MLATLFPTGWTSFLVGGLLIGAGVALMFATLGRVVGMSSVFSSTWSWWSALPALRTARLLDSRSWRLWCALGLALGAALWWWGSGAAGPAQTSVPAWRLLLGGVLVGFGARLSNGCTSGHGICGLSSLSLPSLLAVLIFMAVAITTANLMAWAGGALL